MRRDTESTTYQIRDLRDQPTGRYMLRFQSPSVHPMMPPTITIVWVDAVEVHDGVVRAYRAIPNPAFANPTMVEVVAFSPDFAWFCIAADRVETMAMSEFLEAERTNIREREQIGRDFQRVREAAQSGEESPQPHERPEPKKFDADEWMRRQFGTEGESGH